MCCDGCLRHNGALDGLVEVAQRLKIVFGIPRRRLCDPYLEMVVSSGLSPVLVNGGIGRCIFNIVHLQVWFIFQKGLICTCLSHSIQSRTTSSLPTLPTMWFAI